VLETALDQMQADRSIYDEYFQPNEEVIDLDVTWLVDQLLNHKKKLVITHGLTKVIEVIDEKNIAEAHNRLLKIVKALSTLKSKDDMTVDFNNDADSLVQEMLTVRTEKRIELGFPEFDDAIHGLKPGWLVLLTARPKVGKSRTLVNFAYNMVKKKCNVLIFSLEMPREQYIEMVYSCAGKLDAKRIETRTLSEKEIEKLRAVNVEIKTEWGKLTVVDTMGRVNPNYIKTRIEELELANGLEYDVVIVDHASMMNANYRLERDDLTQGSIAEDLREIAREKKKVLLTAVQRKQEAVKKKDRGDDLSGAGEDVARSDIWFQTADILVILHKPEDTAKSLNLLQYKIISRYCDLVSFELLKDFSITRLFSMTTSGELDLWK
jgi:replicative DNA helicase